VLDQFGRALCIYTELAGLCSAAETEEAIAEVPSSPRPSGEHIIFVSKRVKTRSQVDSDISP
jgi:hypothetical protein